MPQQIANKEYNTFVKGIVTEASPLTFPENASIDEQNFVLNRDGSRQRRLGMDYEQDYILRDTGIDSQNFSDVGVSSHLWKNINQKASLSFYVVQFGDKLFFYDATKSPTSNHPKNSGNSITLPGDRSIRWSVASLGGRFIVVTGDKNVFHLEYDEQADVVTYTVHGLLVRDTWGVDDGLDTDERPSTLSDLHRYNLNNQGWGGVNPDTASGTRYWATFKSDSGTGKYPSNADLVQSGTNTGDSNKFDAKFVVKAFSGNTPAPKGRFIIDLFDRSGSRAIVSKDSNFSGLLNNFSLYGGWSNDIDFEALGYDVFGAFSVLVQNPDFNDLEADTGIPVDKTDSGITATASYAERIFYSGIESTLIGGDSKSPLLGHLVLFSQLVDARDKIGKCYQEGDPTSEDQSDLLATDGGFIRIPEMSRCLKLVPFAKSLLVFAENGVWEITGGEDAGFKATDFQVIKLTDTGAINSTSIVEAEDRVYYWTNDGIYGVFRDQVSLGASIVSISETSVQTLFESYGQSAISTVVGTYDRTAKQIRWMLNTETSYDGVAERFRFNYELVFDVLLEAFYISKLPDTDGDTPYISSYMTTPGFLTTDLVYDVVVGTDDVVVLASDITITESIREGDNTRTLYLVVDPNTSTDTYKYTFGFYKDQSFEDWASNGTGVDAAAYMLTGYETGGDSQRKKQAVYITNHFLRTETGFEDNGSGDLEAVNPSSCLMQAQWDFANSAASNKFGPKFQTYRLQRPYMPSGLSDTFDYGYEVITTKNKVRGRGKALSLLFETEPRKDLVMLGWGTIFGVNQNV